MIGRKRMRKAENKHYELTTHTHTIHTHIHSHPSSIGEEELDRSVALFATNEDDHPHKGNLLDPPITYSMPSLGSTMHQDRTRHAPHASHPPLRLSFLRARVPINLSAPRFNISESEKSSLARFRPTSAPLGSSAAPQTSRHR